MCIRDRYLFALLRASKKESSTAKIQMNSYIKEIEKVSMNDGDKDLYLSELKSDLAVIQRATGSIEGCLRESYEGIRLLCETHSTKKAETIRQLESLLVSLIDLGLKERAIECLKLLHLVSRSPELKDSPPKPLQLSRVWIQSIRELVFKHQKFSRDIRVEDEGLETRAVQEFADGSIYEGQWKDGLRHGVGKQISVDSTAYFGHWSRGKRNGYGIQKYHDDQFYDGEWVDDEPVDAPSCILNMANVEQGEADFFNDDNSILQSGQQTTASSTW
eukprot:TRINITY_DN4865_c0_g1_i2.p1 TRINITY_DN4865_c0_g1~~TRINITY_DN4865_c0_g1_i2.p1  ORF type:complete len:274 (-),score=16.68 TRINITY_DN4865_c0_g1_i2:298-1119(-)